MVVVPDSRRWRMIMVGMWAHTWILRPTLPVDVVTDPRCGTGKQVGIVVRAQRDS